jgi:hypothetical protein
MTPNASSRGRLAMGTRSTIETLELFGNTVGLIFIVPGSLFIFGFIFGFIWSPFAALSSGIIAHRRGRGFLRYAAIGSLFSLLFFFPWVYLTIRMFSKNLPNLLIRICYALVFLVWAGLILGYIAFVLSGSAYVNTILLWGFGIIINIALWVYSLRRIRAAQRERQGSGSAYNQRDIIPSTEYLMPVVFLYLSVWLFLFFWVANFGNS